MKKLLANKVVRQLVLRRGPTMLWCPYCGEQWPRGGKAEGFRVAAANQHVALCWEILLFNAGYLLWAWPQTVGKQVVAKADAWKDDPLRFRRNVRAIKAGIRSRKRAGFEPRIPAHLDAQNT